ncbi:MAG TPA: hypothetical protein P5140_07685 [Methanofastidiosum sp.]|nr:hypothetical protein [Methanofastidiosum sp.]
MHILTEKEILILRKRAGYKLNKLDVAHFLPVSERPDLCYDINNVCLLNRYSHEMLDSFRDPITGAHISRDETFEWWIRILSANKKQYMALFQAGLLDEEVIYEYAK